MKTPVVDIPLKEWESASPDNDDRLAGVAFEDSDSRAQANLLEKSGKVRITELRTGLGIQTNSYVGVVRLGSIQIRIVPKMDRNSLIPLLRYAYGLRNLELLESVNQSTDDNGFEDIIVYQLIAEIKKLLSSGIYRKYVRSPEDLSSPRGRIDFQRLARLSGTKPTTLSCVHHPRTEDHLLNQVLLSGLNLGSSIASDLHLRRDAHRLATTIAENVSEIRLDHSVMAQAFSGITRMTDTYSPAFALIKIILESKGVLLNEGGASEKLSGFLFDMNHFYQALLSRFLRDNLTGYTVQDELKMRHVLRFIPEYNPKGLPSPKPRPDFSVFEGRKLIAILDAKYRDLWEKPLPRDMLYQLALYATTSTTRSASILYPTISKEAKESRLEINEPIHGQHLAQICQRPVILDTLRKHIDSGWSADAQRGRKEYAMWLLNGSEQLIKKPFYS